MTRSIVLYELNEVPWEIVDFYIEQRPGSALGRLLARAASRTTISEEQTSDLQPWRTWPTFHRSLWTRDHNSWDLGQDPRTFQGVDVWTAAARAGRSVGVFGALQSWPARRFVGGFHVPDTFARTPATDPPALRRFQAFNLSMTAENRFAATGDISVRRLPVVAADLMLRGLTLRSAAALGRHLLAERRDESRRAQRAVMQVVPAFDVFWRLHSRRRPELSIFFTNHVASMLHRFWADALPPPGAEPGPGQQAVVGALDLFDQQLHRLLAWLEQTGRSNERALIVASSMGQARVEKREMGSTFVVDDTARLAAALQLVGAEPGVGMYPAQSLMLPTATAAEQALSRLTSVEHAAGPMFRKLRSHGRTVSFEVDYLADAEALPPTATIGGSDGSRAAVPIGDLGISVRRRPSGGNTGEHTQRGILVAAGDRIAVDSSRREVSVLDAAPSILALLGVRPDVSMRGTATLFD